jgi:hypothetical protein
MRVPDLPDPDALVKSPEQVITNDVLTPWRAALNRSLELVNKQTAQMIDAHLEQVHPEVLKGVHASEVIKNLEKEKAQSPVSPSTPATAPSAPGAPSAPMAPKEEALRVKPRADEVKAYIDDLIKRMPAMAGRLVSSILRNLDTQTAADAVAAWALDKKLTGIFQEAEMVRGQRPGVKPEPTAPAPVQRTEVPTAPQPSATV